MTPRMHTRRSFWCWPSGLVPFAGRIPSRAGSSVSLTGSRLGPEAGPARRRAIDLRVAEQAADHYLPSEDATDWDILHDEVDRLPERFRAPLVLCYLEGLTYGAAARQLALSEGTLRGRISQARKRLRRRLTGRGVTIPAVLLTAGVSSQSHASVPAALVHSTIRIARGLTPGHTAAVLARGVLNSMLLSQIKIATVVVLIGSVCLTAGLSWAVGPKRIVQALDTRTPGDGRARRPERPRSRKWLRPQIQVRGVVVDEAGRPVAGAEVRARCVY